MVAVPVGPAACALAVVAQQNDSLSTKMNSRQDCAGPAVFVISDPYALGAETMWQRCKQAPGKYFPNFIYMSRPPRPIHCKQRIGPGRGTKGCIGYNDSSCLWRRP